MTTSQWIPLPEQTAKSGEQKKSFPRRNTPISPTNYRIRLNNQIEACNFLNFRPHYLNGTFIVSRHEFLDIIPETSNNIITIIATISLHNFAHRHKHLRFRLP